MNISKGFTRIIPLTFILFGVFICSGAVHSSNSFWEDTIMIDNNPVETTLTLKDGHLFVPALFMKETGTFVDWDEQHQVIVLRTNHQIITVPLNKKELYRFKMENDTWVQQPLPIEAFRLNEDIFIPLFPIARYLGMDVTYNFILSSTFVTTNIKVEDNQVYKASTNKKLVALTFDDGPEDFYTPKILEILNKKNVPATFFVLGNQVQNFPQQFKKIIDNGHEVGIHTYSHPDFRSIWTSGAREEIERTVTEMQKVAGYSTNLFRPPYGTYTKADMRLLNLLGLKNILWSVDTLDWSGNTSEEIREIVNEEVTPGAIILQHNFESESRRLDGTIEALPDMIDDLKKRGYQFVSVSELLRVNQQIDNH